MAATIAFAGGGTGGHVFPGLAVADALAGTESTIVWVGSADGMERSLVESRGIPFYPIQSGKLRRYFSLKNLLDIFKIVIGFFQSLSILRALRPDVLFSKGGYVSVPPSWAAKLLGIPVVTHESDVSPGLATRLIMGAATTIAVSYTQTVSYLPDTVRSKAHVCGNPVRSAFFHADSARGRRYLKVPEGEDILLVLGGSLGARQLNAMVQELRESLKDACVIVHQGGAELREESTERYIPFQFIGAEYPDILAAADIVLSRAGASTVWEIAALKKPALLVPLGTSSSRGDQIQNAELFASMGAARVYFDGPSARQISDEVIALLADRTALNAMARKYGEYSNDGAAGRVAGLILELANQPATSGREG